MKSSAAFMRSTIAMFAVSVTVLLMIVGASIWLGVVNRDYSDETAALRRVRSAIADLYRNLQDAETGQRGYLLTGDVQYLAPYEDSRRELAGRQQALDTYVVNYPEYKPSLAKLTVAIAQKMSELAETIAMAKSGRMADALGVVRGNRGRDDMVQIRLTLDALLDMTDNQLRNLVSRQLGAASTLAWVTIGGAIGVLLAVGGGIVIIVQHVRDLSAAREEVDQLNRGLESRVTERTRDLIQANQEIQRFAYIVTHDLRAPLVNIMGFLSELDAALKDVTGYVLVEDRPPTEAETMQARQAVRDDVPEAMGFIRTSTRKMDGLINAILKIAREGRRQLQADRIDLQELVQVAADNVQHQVAASGGDVSITIGIRPILSDRVSLEQIFGNLFDNAVKYGVAGRPIRLRIEARADGPGHCTISIADNGRGVAPDDHERIFDLFRRAGQQDQPGEGIGLAYVRSLVRNLGGDITVSSKVGEGATFMIALPTDIRKVMQAAQA